MTTIQNPAAKRQQNSTGNDSFFNDSPQWLQRTLIGLLSVFLCLLPLLFDKTVPEVAGDIRWMLIHITALTGFTLISFGAIFSHRHFNIQAPHLVWVIAGLALLILFSTIDAINPLRTGFFLQHWLSYTGLFFLFFWVRSSTFHKYIPWLLALPLGFNACIGILQYHNLTDAQIHTIFPLWPQSHFLVDWVKNTFLQSAVPGASFANKNLAASYTLLTLPFAMYLAFTSPKLWQKTLTSAITFLALTFLVYSRSRASWIAFTIAITLGLLIIATNKPLRIQALTTLKYKITLPLIALITIGTAYFGNMPSPLHTHGISKAPIEQLKTLSHFDSNQFGPRLAYNLNGIEIVKDFPLNGVGIGNFHTIYPLYHDAQYATPKHGYNVTARPQRAHNDVMQMFIEIGILGGILFVSMWFFALMMTLKLLKANSASKNIALTTFISLTGICTNALADFPLQMPTAPALLFILLGFLTALYIKEFPQKPRYLYACQNVTKKSFLVALTVFFALTTFYISAENLARREGAQTLKKAMQRMQASIIDSTTLAYINQSYQTYPYNSRLIEFRAIAYQNYQGKPPIPTQIQEKITRDALLSDPYAANHHINIANMYLTRAQKARHLKDAKAFHYNIQQAQKELTMLEKIAPFSHYTFGVEGTLHLLTGDLPKARQAYNRALQRNPKFLLALEGIKSINKQSSTNR